MTQQKRFRLPMQETRVPSLGQEDPLEEETATYSSILAWESHGWSSLVGYNPWGSNSQTRLSTSTPSRGEWDSGLIF